MSGTTSEPTDRLDDGTVGRHGLVARHGLWRDGDHAAHERSQRVIEERGIELVRVSFADAHGVLRSKTLTVGTYERACRGGYTVPSTLLLKDTSCRTVVPVFEAGAGIGVEQLTGVADLVLVPDPTTFHVLPWAPNTAWVLCDLYFPDGTAAPFSTRACHRRALEGLAAHGYEHLVGLEVEFHVFRLTEAHLAPTRATWPGTPPSVEMLAHGYQLVSEERLDQLDDVVQLLHRTTAALDLPIRSVELELGPGQLEVTFDPLPGLRAADAMVLFRTAVKQACRRHGLHATFMCRPAVENTFSSGWHLHQSLVSADGSNALMATDRPLSDVGRHVLGGLLEHARAGAVFSTPTVNGYKRYRPFSLAPDRVAWGLDNKGAMLRVVGVPGDPGTRIENRIGEPAANPYLYMASQVVAATDGIERQLEPGDPVDEPYAADRPRLPATLMEALDALAADTTFRDRMGAQFVDWLLRLKRAEVDRYLQAVTDWEQAEYFDLF